MHSTSILIVLISILLFGCSKQPVNPAFTDDDISYRAEATIDSLTGDTIFFLYLPNAFSPNGDGINDVFGPIGIGFSSRDYSLKIFNRLDNVVFETNDFRIKWDGKTGKKICRKGIYEYGLTVNDVFGVQHRFIGSILLFN